MSEWSAAVSETDQSRKVSSVASLRPGLLRPPPPADLMSVGWSTIAPSEDDRSIRIRPPRKHKQSHSGASRYVPHSAIQPYDWNRSSHMAFPPPGGALMDTSLTPVSSVSMLTCNAEFKKQFPYVFQGLCKGMIDIRRLMSYEIVIPIKEDVSLNRSTIRSRKAVTNAICDQLWRSLQGRFPDAAVAPKLIKKMADYFYDKIEYGIQDAEDERTFLQWLFRFDIENAVNLRQSITMTAGKNSVLAIVEGSAHLKRRKGELFNLIKPDSVTLNIECVIKGLFLNGGHLQEINSDSLFIDHVRAGDNRFTRNFLL